MVVNEEVFFSIDTRLAGWGDLNIKIECCKNSSSVPIKVDERGDGIYNISFLPELDGKYLLFVNFNQQNIKNSPFMFYVGNEKNGNMIKHDSIHESNANVISKDIQIFDLIVKSFVNF